MSVKILLICPKSSLVRWQKMALLVLRKVGLCGWGKSKCAICGSAIKLVLKNVRLEKNKKHRVGMSACPPVM